MSGSKLVQALRRTLRRRFNIDIVGAGNTTTLRFHLEELLRAYRIDVVLDVGANEGQFGAQLRELGFAGAIHSFEPVKKTYARLAATAAGDGNWTTHNVALGRQPGKLQINVSEASVFSSFLRPSSFGSTTFGEMKVETLEEVEVTTLDSFVGRHIGRDRRILLKMDTQGYDLEVFAGAVGSVERICGVLSELSLIPIYEGMPDYLDALAVYRERGFSISGVYPVNRNADLSLIEVDCFLVNTKWFADGRHRPASSG